MLTPRSALAAIALWSGVFALTLLPSSPASARPLRIIHTNDLHSHLDHAEDPAFGGYAAVKAVIDSLRAESASQGVETLVLDAGDFTEGSEYYLADRGAQVWRAMNAMGYDAVTLGNHDWFQGERELDRVLGRVPPAFPLLGANFIFSSHSPRLARSMRQWTELTRAGLRIAVLGLTTDDIQYEWMMADSGGFINSIEDEARRDLPILRRRNDLVIGLTHIGDKADSLLVRKVAGFDLMVGGHSHVRLEAPLWARDPSGRRVPIVQAGMHGERVGDLLVDAEPGKPLQVLSYRLVPVASGGPRDAAMERLKDEAERQLEAEYGRDWLNEIVGASEVPLLNAWRVGEPTRWGSFVAEAIRRAGDAEAAVDVSEFTGQSQPAGPITRRQLFILYPRMSDVSHRLGWNVWTVQVSGLALKLILEVALGSGTLLNLAGIDYDAVTSPDGSRKVSRIRVNGAAISTGRSYRIAVPEGIVRGGFGITRLLKAILRQPRDTGVSVWEAAERHLGDLGVIRATDP